MSDCHEGWRQRRVEYQQQQSVQGIFAGPAEPETGERDSDLRDREQFLGLSEKRERDPGAGLAFIGEAPQARVAHREQCDFRAREKGVDREDQAEQDKSRDVCGGGHLFVSLNVA